MNAKQKAVLIGMILGDAYLQKTGSMNARIRLEQSEKQQDYLYWKVRWFPEFFQGKPSYLTRYNPVYRKMYAYVRWQSNSSPEIGNYRRLFYINGRKIIPKILPSLLAYPMSLAVWYMDDGYLYDRDKMAYIYLPKYSQEEIIILQATLKQNFGLMPTVKIKKRGNVVLTFSVRETEKLLSFVAEFVIPSFMYKLLNPVSTEA